MRSPSPSSLPEHPSLIAHVVALLALSLSGDGAGARESTHRLAIVTHPDTPIADTRIAELQSWFSGNAEQWADGTEVIPLVAPPGSDRRNLFDRIVLGLTPFSGPPSYGLRKVPSEQQPLQVSRVEHVLSVVALVPGAVAYVPAQALPETPTKVKVLTIDGLGVFDGDYALRSRNEAMGPQLPELSQAVPPPPSEH